jgi:hypothetical protein
MSRTCFFAALAAALVLVNVTNAAVHLFDLSGKGGTGLLSTNENNVINGNPGSGGEIGAGIFYDDVTNLLTINIGWGSGHGFTNLTGIATDHHIHGPTVSSAPAGFNENASVRIGLASLAGFNNSATMGGFSGTISLDATQETELLAQRYYLNVHTSVNGPGEIRGHLVIVPEPCCLLLFACASVLTLLGRRQRG